jgi:phenylpropionate dioxygenase-like ring-hydroxylating dioxygenase large terminal subunit
MESRWDSAQQYNGDAGMNNLPKAPPVHAFPEHPASWYLFAHLDELRKGPLTKMILGRRLVAFHTESGRVAVLDAHCSHLGADLGRGDVVGETIRCPFHHWRFGCDGRCEEIPSANDIPPFARQTSYPVAVRHGCVFFFNGPEALFPLPFFDGEDPEAFAASRPFSFSTWGTWYMLAAQGFDAQHFETVHNRRLLAPSRVDYPAPFARRNRYHAEIVGASLADRLLRATVGATVEVSIVNWGGTMFTVKAQFPRACSRFFISSQPLDDEHTRCDVIVYALRGAGALALPLRRWLTRAHLVPEADQLRYTQYRPGRFIPADADMVECFQWLAELPQRKPAAGIAAPRRSQTAVNPQPVTPSP